MKLNTASKVLATMGVVENPGSLLSASRALDHTYPIIESLLETTLTEQHVTDYFDIRTGNYYLRLKNRFIDAYALEVRVSADGSPLLLPTDGDLVPDTDYRVDQETGLLTFLKQVREGDLTLSVSYDSGLRLSDDGTYLEAPYWLAEAAVAIAVQAQNTLVSSPANRKDKTVVNVHNELYRIVSMHLNGHRRPRLVVTYPALSVVDD